MTPQQRDQILDLAILEALDACGGMLMAHANLISQVQITQRPKPFASEVALRIRKLDSRGYVLSQPGDYGHKYKLTDEGKAFWTEHGSD